MDIRDRRSGQERRGTKRYQVELDVEWQSARGKFPGSMSDVNLDGCFILSSGDVDDGEQVNVYVPMAEGLIAEFGGLVANHVFEIGFGVKFGTLSPTQRDLLFKIVRDFEKN